MISFKNIAGILLTLTLFGCGGGGSRYSSPVMSSPTPVTQQTQFEENLDAPPAQSSLIMKENEHNSADTSNNDQINTENAEALPQDAQNAPDNATEQCGSATTAPENENAALTERLKITYVAIDAVHGPAEFREENFAIPDVLIPPLTTVQEVLDTVEKTPSGDIKKLVYDKEIVQQIGPSSEAFPTLDALERDIDLLINKEENTLATLVLGAQNHRDGKSDGVFSKRLFLRCAVRIVAQNSHGKTKTLERIMYVSPDSYYALHLMFCSLQSPSTVGAT